MKLIDNKLGGTTSLIIKFPKDENVLEEDDDYEEEKDESKYWFTSDKIDKITKVHDYLDELDSIGKVIFASIVRVAEDLNEVKTSRS